MFLIGVEELLLPADSVEVVVDEAEGEVSQTHQVVALSKSEQTKQIKPVFWIRIRIRSVFISFVDPDPYSEYGSTHVNYTIKYRQKV